jgi:hypothetical protein
MPVLLACPQAMFFAHLACPLNDIIFCLHQEQPTYTSTNIAVVLFKKAGGYGSRKYDYGSF